MIRFLLALPNGVLEFTPMFRDVPQTSLSLGIVNTVADGIRTHSLVRSSINSQKQMVMDKIECIAEEFGASVETEGAYPAWELIPKSDFRDLAAEVYKETTGKEALVCVTHGGLECGLITSKVPGIDCISVGPDMEEIHTPKTSGSLYKINKTSLLPAGLARVLFDSSHGYKAMKRRIEMTGEKRNGSDQRRLAGGAPA